MLAMRVKKRKGAHKKGRSFIPAKKQGNGKRKNRQDKTKPNTKTFFIMNTVIGERAGERIEVKTQDRRHHLYLLGQTGAGKSTLLKNMAIEDMRNGAGLAVIDPHGDLVEDILNFIPKKRLQENHLIYFNPADNEHPAGLNILETGSRQNKELAASSLVSVFRHLWRDSWGPRTEYLLYNATLALMDAPGQTLLGVYRILVDASFREGIVRQVKDPMVKLFWKDVFGGYDERFKTEVVSPIQNKVGQLLTGSCLRNIVGQTKSSFDMKRAMDSGQIILANLSKGRIGEDRANLLGSILVTKLYLAALERQTMPETQRKDFYLYVDEFQNFTTDVFPSILSEARKYRLNLILAHQYLDQLPESIQRAVFGNVGSWAVFRVGSADAQTLSKEFFPYFDAEELGRQRNYEVVYKKLIDGVPDDPSFAVTPPPVALRGDEAEREAVVRASRERFAKRRGKVEERIERWFGSALIAL
jgi:hypothetical protein